jgi:hypothetical protein
MKTAVLSFLLSASFQCLPLYAGFQDDPDEDHSAGVEAESSAETGAGVDESSDPEDPGRQEVSSNAGVVLQIPLASLSISQIEAHDETENFSNQNIGNTDGTYIMLQIEYFNIYVYPFQNENEYISVSKYILDDRVELGLDLGINRSTRQGEKVEDLVAGVWLTHFSSLTSRMPFELSVSYAHSKIRTDVLDEMEEVSEATRSWSAIQLSGSLAWAEYADNLHFFSRFSIMLINNESDDLVERILTVELIPLEARIFL